MKEQVQWTSPSPLWTVAARVEEPALRRATLQRPTLLRFASDTFMDDFMQLLAADPARVTEFIAKPETWRGSFADTPIGPVQNVPALARRLARLGLNAERERRGITGDASSRIAAISTGVTSGLTETSAVLSLSPVAKKPPLKLYQPAHQRYYLVTAHLVCGRTGLPDRAINAARAERVSFVLRRLLPPGVPNPDDDLPDSDPATWEEFAFVSNGKSQRWQRIQQPTQPVTELVKGEEQLPLFGVSFAENDGRKRRLFAGLVPVGRREAYMGATQDPQAGDPQPEEPPEVADPRMMLFWSQVTEPWNRMLETADAARRTAHPRPVPQPSDDGPLTGDALLAAVKAAREQIQTVSWYALLDFAKLLEQYIPNVWATLAGLPLPNAPLKPNESALVDALHNATIPQPAPPSLFTALQNSRYPASKIATSLAAALTAMNGGSSLDNRTRKDIEDGLEAAAKSYDRENPESVWPQFIFPFADSEFAGPLPPRDPAVTDDADPLKKSAQRIEHLSNLIKAALPQPTTEEMPQTGLAGQPVFDTREGWFIIRCVFERPECGKFDPPLLSAPTRPFQLAAFFDSDAPARPIRIALPIDTTPAGLRKFDKNTAFMISDVLCGQINRVKSLGLGDLIRSVLPFPLHKDLSVPDGGACTDKKDPNLQVGMICSMSIPIITICALLLLMIIVNLLDIIFRWIPFFLICFPLPGLKAKK